MKIGKIQLKNKYILAPMAGITNLPFRLLCKEQGCSLVYTEMISAKGLYYEDKKTKELMKTVEKEKPVGIQIFGSDPHIMSEVVKKYINTSFFDLIDINFGCPAPKIVKNGDGAALLRRPQLIGEIIHNVVKVSEKPITIKIRTGWDNSSINAVEIAKISQQAGANAITVHGRTREQFYSGNADWNIIKQVKNNVDIPVIANGDVTCREDVKNIENTTYCDGVMIGRAAMGNPWIFDEVNTDKVFADIIISDNDKIDMAIRHMEMMLSIKPEKVVLGEIRKHISLYTKGLRNSTVIRNAVNKANSCSEIREILIRYLEIS
ncbi:MAG: tRNA dihydrouridine synthase DusB [Eubacteriaceae bacterium]